MLEEDDEQQILNKHTPASTELLRNYSQDYVKKANTVTTATYSAQHTVWRETLVNSLQNHVWWKICPTHLVLRDRLSNILLVHVHMQQRLLHKRYIAIAITLQDLLWMLLWAQCSELSSYLVLNAWILHHADFVLRYLASYIASSNVISA